MKQISVKAMITGIEGETLSVSFEHPDYGSIEREVHLETLPSPVSEGEIIDLTMDRAQERTTTVKARVEWLDVPLVIVSFEHPKLGRCEREFAQSALPDGANSGDTFDLVIELDASGMVCGYNPRRDSLKKYVLKEWEKIPLPKPPENLDDKDEMDRYAREMAEYSAKVSALRRPGIQAWLNGKK